MSLPPLTDDLIEKLTDVAEAGHDVDEILDVAGSEDGLRSGQDRPRSSPFLGP